jgi:hypothetical protein
MTAEAGQRAELQRQAAVAFEERLRVEKEQALLAAQAARNQALAAQDKEHTAALRRSADELAALKTAVQQREQELHQHYKARLAEAAALAARGTAAAAGTATGAEAPLKLPVKRNP